MGGKTFSRTGKRYRKKLRYIDDFQSLKSLKEWITLVTSYGTFIWASFTLIIPIFRPKNQSRFPFLFFVEVNRVVKSLKTPWQTECIYSGTNALTKSKLLRFPKGVGPKIPLIGVFSVAPFRSWRCWSKLLGRKVIGSSSSGSGSG